MEIEKGMVHPDRRTCLRPAMNHRLILGACLAFLLLCAGMAPAQTILWPKIALSKDGTPITYEVFGAGEPTLVFVHGWCGDSRYWRAQVPYFARHHRVVVLDLAGHGNSGQGRSKYTMQAFGEDVKAVCDSVGASQVILIGHSMGGAVIAEAARLMPGRVIGLIGVDTLENIEYPLTQGELDKMVSPMEKDFRAGSRAFVGEMFSPLSDAKLREWVLGDIASAPPAVALSAVREMMSQYITGRAATVFDGLDIPVVTVNADLWPINYVGNRRHMASYDAILIKGADHFLMMNRPQAFNPALEKAVHMVLKKSGELKKGRPVIK